MGRFGARAKRHVAVWCGAGRVRRPATERSPRAAACQPQRLQRTSLRAAAFRPRLCHRAARSW
eukprot:6226285-Prymnesium_polylepis.2